MRSKALSLKASVLILTFAVFGAAWFALKDEKSPAEPLGEDRIESSAFSRLVDQKGAEEAYGEFKAAYSDRPFDLQHGSAHIVGRTLYDKVGLDGFSICDESFAFGCYHAFLGRAIADRGVSIIPELASSCRKRYGENDTGCAHGIGHGIMEYLGPEKLASALELCKGTDQRGPLYGCTSGAFMEYNTATLFRGDMAYTKLREPNPDNLHEPCDSLPDIGWRQSCYFEVGLWWKDLFEGDLKKPGDLCAGAPGDLEREACFKGWGTVVAENVGYDPAEAKAVCGLIEDAEGALICRAGVASRFKNDGTHAIQAKQVCADDDLSMSLRCERESSL